MELSQEQLALLPTDDEVRFYEEHGYYVSKRIFSDDEIEAALRGSDRFYGGHVEPSGIAAVDDFMTKYGPKGNYGNRLRKHDYASFGCRELRRLVLSPVIGAKWNLWV